MYCKKCGGEKHVKAGFIDGEQRYKCKDCGCKFVPTRHRGKPEKDKLLAVWLYLHGLSFRTIAKLLKVTHKSIYDWVKTFAKANYIKPMPQGSAVIVELDEIMCNAPAVSSKGTPPTGSLITCFHAASPQ